MIQRRTLLSFCVIACVSAASQARAQAWAPEEQTIGVGVGYQFANATKSGDVPSDVTFQIVSLGAEYVLPKQIAVTAKLPYVIVKKGTDGSMHGPYDDGSYHSTLTDLRFGVRRPFQLAESFSLAPALNFTIPLTDYPIQGNAAVGRHLKQAHLGLAAGWAPVDGALYRLFVHAQYEFTLSEKLSEGGPETEAFSQNRSDIEAQVGYLITDKLQAQLMSVARIAHDGVRFAEFGSLSDTVLLWHDALLKEQFVLLGAGVAYQYDSFNFALSLLAFVAGQNTINPLTAALTVSWTSQ